jgi:hypothetical protein
MTEPNALIPKAGQIDLPASPTISAVDFIRQVIENVNAQMMPLDGEICKASMGDSAFVSYSIEFNCMTLPLC